MTKVDIDDYRKWVDSVIRSDLPDPNDEPALFELVVNIEMKSVGSVLANFSQAKP